MAVQKIVIALFALAATALLAAPSARAQYYDEVPLKEPVYLTWLAEEGIILSDFDIPASKKTCSVVAKLSEASNDNAPKSEGAPPLSRWEACGKLLDAAGDNEVVYNVLHNNKLHREFAAAVRDLRPVIVAQVAKQTDAANTPHNRRERLRLLGWLDGLMRLYPKADGEEVYRLEWEGAPRIWAGYGSVTLGQEANLYAVNYGAYENYSKLLAEHKGLEYGIPEWVKTTLENEPYWLVGDVEEIGRRKPYTLAGGLLYGFDPYSGRISLPSLAIDDSKFHGYLRLVEFYRPAFTYYFIFGLEQMSCQRKLTSLRELSSILALYGFEKDRADCLRLAQADSKTSDATARIEWPLGGDTTIPGETTAFIDDIYRAEDESSVAAKGEETAARILLDILLNEEAIQPIIEDAGLRLDYERAAVSLRIPIAREFALALQSPNSKMHAQAMLWADGLMRVAPLVEGEKTRALEWERASRASLIADINSRTPSGTEFAKDYWAFLEETGCAPESYVTIDTVNHLLECLGDSDPGWWYWGVQSNSEVGYNFWGRLGSRIDPARLYPIKYMPVEPTYRDDRTVLTGLIRGTDSFRPWFALNMFSFTGSAMASEVPAPKLVEGVLEMWGLWIEQQDAATKPPEE